MSIFVDFWRQNKKVKSIKVKMAGRCIIGSTCGS